MTTICALCDEEITEDNDSREHVIPNAIGGRKKIRGFICSDCNTKSGDDWDSALASDLNPLSLFFGISRSRGKPPSQKFETTGGDELALSADGSMTLAKPVFNKTPVKEGTHINYRARSMSEATRMLSGLKRKYPQIDYDELINNAEEKSAYCKDYLKLDVRFGGEKAGRSIVKSALALAVETGISANKCEHAHEYLLDEKAEACFGYYYERDLVLNRQAGIPFHCVYIWGNPKSKLLLGYVELFGVQRMVLCLSSNYKGEEFTNSYSINPMDGTKLDIKVDLNLTFNDIKLAYEYKKMPKGSVEEALSQVIPTGNKYWYDQERDRVLNEAVEYAFANCGAKEGEKLTLEQKKKVSSLVFEKMEAFILHNFSINRKQE